MKVAALYINTKNYNDTVNFKEVKLFKDMQTALIWFKYSNYRHLELKELNKDYYEFVGTDFEGFTCDGSLFLQPLLEV